MTLIEENAVIVQLTVVLESGWEVGGTSPDTNKITYKYYKK